MKGADRALIGGLDPMDPVPGAVRGRPGQLQLDEHSYTKVKDSLHSILLFIPDRDGRFTEITLPVHLLEGWLEKWKKQAEASEETSEFWD